MSVIQDIAIGLNKGAGNIEECTGEELELLLTNISRDLSRLAYLTEEKADIEFLLMVVGSYLISKEEGNLDADAVPPAELFDINLIPTIKAMEELVVEAVEEEEDDK